MVLQQPVAQGIGVALQRGAIGRCRHLPDALVDGLRGIAADLHMALLVVGQSPQVPVKSRLLLGARGLQFGQLHLGVQPGGDLGDRAAARGFAPPTEGPAHVPAGIALKALPTHRNGGGGMQGRAQALTRLGAHHVGSLGVFFLHLRVYAAGAQQPSDCTRPACPGAERQGGQAGHSPQGSISVSSDSWSNSGANASMICCGSGHKVVSVITPNCTPPP